MSTKTIPLTLLPRRCSVALTIKYTTGYRRMTSEKNINLEKSLAELETLVGELESGDLPLDKAMKKFEEGIKLTRGCQKALKEAEQKVEILLKSAGGQESLGKFEDEG